MIFMTGLAEERMAVYMADIIIITVLAIIVFFVVRSQLHRLRKGQCGSGCAGCQSCPMCQDSAEKCVELHTEER